MSNIDSLLEIARRGNEEVQRRRNGEYDGPQHVIDMDDVWSMKMNNRTFESQKMKPIAPSRIGTFGA